MAEKDKQDREFAVGDKLKFKLHDGRIVDATVRAIVDDGEPTGGRTPKIERVVPSPNADAQRATRTSLSRAK